MYSGFGGGSRYQQITAAMQVLPRTCPRDDKSCQVKRHLRKKNNGRVKDISTKGKSPLHLRVKSVRNHGIAYRLGTNPIISKCVESSGSWKLSSCRNMARYSCKTGALSCRKKLLRYLARNFCRHANVNASSLKLSVRNGAHRESRPCQ